MSWKWVIFGEIYSILGYVISTSKLAQVESIFLHFRAASFGSSKCGFRKLFARSHGSGVEQFGTSEEGPLYTLKSSSWNAFEFKQMFTSR